jgi:DNA-directed RNA polymerase specialized sigma24 family protein
VHNVVTAEDLVQLFVASRAAAVRLARSLVGDLLAEDAVQSVFVYFVARRPMLREIPSEPYLLVATRNQCLDWLRRAHVRRTLATCGKGLQDLEAMQFALTHGRARTLEVAVPVEI